MTLTGHHHLLLLYYRQHAAGMGLTTACTRPRPRQAVFEVKSKVEASNHKNIRSRQKQFWCHNDYSHTSGVIKVVQKKLACSILLMPATPLGFSHINYRWVAGVEAKASWPTPRPMTMVFEAKATIFCPRVILEVKDSLSGCHTSLTFWSLVLMAEVWLDQDNAQLTANKQNKCTIALKLMLTSTVSTQQHLFEVVFDSARLLALAAEFSP